MLDVFNADRGVPRSTLGVEASGPSMRDLSAVSPADIDKVQDRTFDECVVHAPCMQQSRLHICTCLVELAMAGQTMLRWTNGKARVHADR